MSKHSVREFSTECHSVRVPLCYIGRKIKTEIEKFWVPNKCTECSKGPGTAKTTLLYNNNILLLYILT